MCACVCVYVYMHVYKCTYLILFASFDWNGGGGGGYVGRIYTAIYLGSPNPSCKTLIPLAPCSAGFGRSCRGAKCLRALGRGLELRRPLAEKRIGLNEQKRCGGGGGAFGGIFIQNSLMITASEPQGMNPREYD